MRVATIPSPVGPFTVVESQGAVLASGWTDDVSELLALVAVGLRAGEPVRMRQLGMLTDAAVAYFDGDLDAVATVPVRQRSGPFRERAWDELRRVPAGAPVSYADYARRCGRPAAVRAAASACARNAAALYVPCHRVVRTGGSLGGFRWGLPVKRWLLDHEVARRGPELATTVSDRGPVVSTAQRDR
jgi:methylated-DNA-[protein]-cysteine S-methyltransferase